ncbi:MAG: segregation/condensation protein A [Betaproteobacteria bacterium]|jgi:segregation and condensation protein A|nr:MAG: segregation/condensation protein A [Betaproteobacteria bacterium]
MSLDVTQATPQPLARFKGEPIVELPADLYIPPEALEVVLEAFEGPLDLLLYLIRRHNLDVLDIPMADLTRQYMAYVEMMHEHQLELAAEYLLIAAMLTEIKSRMLLPRPIHLVEEEDPRAELVRRLVEYERMKLAAQKINELPQVGRDFTPVSVWFDRSTEEVLPDVDAEDLRSAWLGLLARARVRRHHRISREELSVREHMSEILRRLHNLKFVRFEELFDPERGVAVLVVTFLAILELAKENLVEVSQQGVFSPIYVRLTHELATV